MDARALGTEVEDLVLVKDTGQLAVVDCVGGQSDDGSDDGEDSDYQMGFYDGRGVWRRMERLDEMDGGMEEDGESEEGSDDDYRDIPSGHVLVTLLEDGSSVVCEGGELDVIDRRFVHGDIVSDSADGDHQCAVVCGIHVELTARRLKGRNYVGEEFKIDSKKLEFIGGLQENCLVMKDAWLGRVTHFVEEITVRFPGGAIGDVEHLPGRLAPAHNAGSPDIDGFFYPGQEVFLSNLALQETKWIKGKSTVHSGIVKAVKMCKVGVNWIATKTTNVNEDSLEENLTRLSEVCTGSELTPLNASRHTWWRAGDKGILPADTSSNTETTAIDDSKPEEENNDSEAVDADSDSEMEVDMAAERSKNGVQKGGRGEKRRTGRLMKSHRRRQNLIAARKENARLGKEIAQSLPDVVEIISTETVLDLLWQDGTRSEKVPAKSFVPVRHLDTYDFFPGHFVTRVADPTQTSNLSMNGVVECMNQAERTARVVWQKPDGNGFEETGQDISVYDLSFNPDFDLHIGDVVVRILPTGMEHLNAWAGEVVHCGIGTVEVDWNDGTRSEVAPDSLIVLYKDEMHDDDDDESMAFGDSEDASDHEGHDNYGMDEDYLDTEEGGEIASRAAREALEMTDNDQNREEQAAGLNQQVNTEPSGGILGKLFRGISAAVSSRLSGMKATDVETTDRQQHAGEEQPREEPGVGANTRATGVELISETTNRKLPGEEIEHVGTSDVHFDAFKVTDEEPEGHHFLATQRVNTRLALMVRKEWQRLASSTPTGVFVHAYESRLDLLRVAIIGSKDTPYEDCLFFFDLQLPEDYPVKPPKVYFHSHGRRLNPNLYEDGKVCLSILGTWNGDKVEQWDPKTSNILRVLLSLQAIVLTAEPYYNEAGFERQAGSTEGKNKSKLYNESAMLLTLRHAMSTCRENGHPSDFSDFVRQHFRNSTSDIVARCSRMLESNDHSVGFKKSLRDLIPRLQELTQNSFST